MLSAKGSMRLSSPGARARASRAFPRCVPRALKVGDHLPDFKLPTDNGTIISSKDMVRDHGAVLFIYPQACTSGCTLQANGFKDNIRVLADKGYAVYGMSADEPAAQAGWKAEHGFPFPLLSDTSKQVLGQLGALNADRGIKRCHFVIARGGKVEDAQIGIGSKDSVPVALAFVASK